MAITTPKTARGNAASGERTTDDDLQSAFDEHWSWVCRMLYRLIGDWDEAEDLAIEVFCRLHDRPPADWDRVSGWLYRVATNAGLNALRARQRRRRYEEEAGALSLDRDAPPDPAAAVERIETQHQVQQVLAGMRPRAAQVLVLRHSGLSYAEIAQALNVAPGSVGTLLARAERAFERRYCALEASDETS
jgi:RNA polymerase sigma-70 factor (ECF subfamily)